MNVPPKKRVVILGGGHSCVKATMRLIKNRRRRDNLEIVIVSRENYENWHGLIPSIASGMVQPQFALLPLRQILPGTIIYNYAVEHIDLDGRIITIAREGERDKLRLTYDYLILALGSVTDESQFPGLREHALEAKSIEDVFRVRNHILTMLERAAVEEDPIERQRMLTFVVVGGGLAGTEIGSLTHELVHDSLRFFPSIQPTEIRFVIASRAERVMPEMTHKITRSSLRLLARPGLDPRTGVSVAAATPYKVTLSTGEEIPTRTIIATTGVRAHPLVQTLPVATDEMGRVICERTCQVPGYPGVYAAGDNAAVPDASGNIIHQWV